MTAYERTLALRRRLGQRREAHRENLAAEARRLSAAAAQLGVERVILFGSAAWGTPGLASDLDLLVVWDTQLDCLSRTVELYRLLEPRVPLDLMVYTPDELPCVAGRPMIRRALEEGEVLYEA